MLVLAVTPSRRLVLERLEAARPHARRRPYQNTPQAGMIRGGW
jgi:hypothetical protein